MDSGVIFFDGRFYLSACSPLLPNLLEHLLVIGMHDRLRLLAAILYDLTTMTTTTQCYSYLARTCCLSISSPTYNYDYFFGKLIKITATSLAEHYLVPQDARLHLPQAGPGSVSHQLNPTGDNNATCQYGRHPRDHQCLGDINCSPQHDRSNLPWLHWVTLLPPP